MEGTVDATFEFLLNFERYGGEEAAGRVVAAAVDAARPETSPTAARIARLRAERVRRGVLV
jgi:hypothetical protein